MARDLKFRIKAGEGLYYPCSENKDADQLRGYRGADLRLCFRICKNPVFYDEAHLFIANRLSSTANARPCLNLNTCFRFQSIESSFGIGARPFAKLIYEDRTCDVFRSPGNAS